MPDSVNWNARRLVLFRLIIDLMREAYRARNDDGDFGSNAERSLLVLAVAIGQIEGRRMSASKVAQYVGIPRATAGRKLHALCKAGLMDRDGRKEFYIPRLQDCPARWIDAISAMERSVIAASTELTKMGSVAIARQK